MGKKKKKKFAPFVQVKNLIFKFGVILIAFFLHLHCMYWLLTRMEHILIKSNSASVCYKFKKKMLSLICFLRLFTNVHQKGSLTDR